MLIFQPEEYRESARRLQDLAARSRAGEVSEQDAVAPVVAELEALVGGRPATNLQWLNQASEKIRDRGTESPDQIDVLVGLLLQLADEEEQNEIAAGNLFT